MFKVENCNKIQCNNYYGICTQATWIHVKKVKIYIQYVNRLMDKDASLFK